MIARTKDVTGPHFLAQLNKYVAPHPLIADVRTAGLFCGVELDPALMMFEKGFIVRNDGPKFIMAPPFIGKLEELTDLAKTFGETLEAFYQIWEAKRLQG